MNNIFPEEQKHEPGGGELHQSEGDERDVRKAIYALVNNDRVDRIEVVGGGSFDVSDKKIKVMAQEEIFTALRNGGKINVYWADGGYSPDLVMETISDLPDQQDGQIAA